MINAIKTRQKDVLDRIKETLNTIQELKDRKAQGKTKIELEKKLVEAEKRLDDLDLELYEVTREEKRASLRILKLCTFLIKYCHVNTSSKIYKLHIKTSQIS